MATCRDWPELPSDYRNLRRRSPAQAGTQRFESWPRESYWTVSPGHNPEKLTVVFVRQSVQRLIGPLTDIADSQPELHHQLLFEDHAIVREAQPDEVLPNSDPRIRPDGAMSGFQKYTGCSMPAFVGVQQELRASKPRSLSPLSILAMCRIETNDFLRFCRQAHSAAARPVDARRRPFLACSPDPNRRQGIEEA